MKPLQIDPDKLTEYLIDNCYAMVHDDKGNRHCRTKRQKRCDVPMYLREQCPDDCPRLFVESTRCDGIECKTIRKILKKMEI